MGRLHGLGQGLQLALADLTYTETHVTDYAGVHALQALKRQCAMLAAMFLLVSCLVQEQPDGRSTELSAATATQFFTPAPKIVGSGAFLATPSPPVVVTLTARPEPSATPIVPTPTFPTRLFSTTPDTSWKACEDTPLSRLHVGDYAFVSYDPFISHRVRTRPSLSISSILGLIAPGEVIEILGGPECFAGAVWWEVSSLRKVLQGWAQEGEEGVYWFIPASAAAGSRVSLSEQMQACPVNDASFCDFVRTLEPAIERGDLEAIFSRTLVTACPADPADPPGQDSAATPPPAQECAYLGIAGTGLSGFDLTATSMISTSWAFYSGSSREIAFILLPPFPELNEPDVIVPDSPAIYIETQDPNWDWWISMEKTDPEWIIISLMMVAREARLAEILAEHAIPWR